MIATCPAILSTGYDVSVVAPVGLIASAAGQGSDTDAAIRLASSTSGPGSGTNTAAR